MLKNKQKAIIAAAATAVFGVLGTPAQAQNTYVTEQQILDYGACWGPQRDQVQDPYGQTRTLYTYDCPREFYYTPQRPASDNVICVASAFNPAQDRVRYVCGQNDIQPPDQWVPLHRHRYPGYNFRN